MLEHEQALDLISARLDGALTAEQSAALEEHLAVCPDCRTLLADLEQLHAELPGLAAQPPAGLKDDIMAAVRQSKVTPFQRQRKQWRWRSLASLAAVLVLVCAGGAAMRQWEGAASRAGQVPAAGGAHSAVTQDTAAPAPAAVQPSAPCLTERSLDTPQPYIYEPDGQQEAQTVQPSAVPAGEPSPLPSAAPDVTSGKTVSPTAPVGPEVHTAGAGLTQDEAVEKLAVYLGWAEDGTAADSAGPLTRSDSADGTVRTITCTGLNEARTGWVCQVEEISPAPDGSASRTTYTVPLDGGDITQP